MQDGRCSRRYAKRTASFNQDVAGRKSLDASTAYTLALEPQRCCGNLTCLSEVAFRGPLIKPRAEPIIPSTLNHLALLVGCSFHEIAIDAKSNTPYEMLLSNHKKSANTHEY